MAHPPHNLNKYLRPRSNPPAPLYPTRTRPLRYEWEVTLKITNCGKEEHKSALEELDISQRISRLQSSHQGHRYVRVVKESFGIQGALDEHLCLVYEPLREPLWLLGKRLGSSGVPSAVLKPFLNTILLGLDFLHSECRIIHTDLKADSFLVGFETSDVVEAYVRQQEVDPAPFKDDGSGGRPVVQSRPDFEPPRKGVGLVKISDFGASVSGDVTVAYNHDIQPQPFCAPEMMWIFSPPLRQLLDRADPAVFGRFFHSNGEFKFPDVIPPEGYNLSNLTPFLNSEDKRLFIKLASRMLRWEPTERATAKELYDDAWLDFKA
ncbi:kinase-like domain-containing protein [Aspergillus heterothallicus]